MNQFVNFNLREVQLPGGCADLADILRARKCEYCGDNAIAAKGRLGDFRWCEACQRDLTEFAGREDYTAACRLPDDAAISIYRADLQRREDEFMHKRVNERKAHDAI